MILINLIGSNKTKICGKCKTQRSLDEFHKCNRNKDGLVDKCKKCRSQAKPIPDYVLENKKRCHKCKEVKDKTGEFWQRSRTTKDGFQGACKICRNKHHNIYCAANRDRINQRNREHSSLPEIKERRKEWSKEYNKKNKARRQEYHKAYREREYVRKNKNEWAKKKHHEKWDSDIMYKLGCCFKSILAKSLRREGLRKDYKPAFDFVPYTKEELKFHLERQFDDKMNWGNYGEYWVLDHIIPRVKFEFSSYEDDGFQKCWALSNLRPLEKIANLSKGAKILPEFEEFAKVLLKRRMI